MKFFEKLRRFFYRGLKRDRFRIVHRDGINYLVNYKNSIDRKIIINGGYEKEQIACFLSLVNKHSCTLFYDIGANIGLYTLNVSRLKTIRRIVAFEPLPLNICQFQANLLLNNLEDVVQLKTIGLSNCREDVVFLGNTGNSTGRSSIKETNINELDENKFKERVIEVDRLDNLEKLKGESIAIKIDVEGHEINVLHGMKDILKENSCIIQIESFDEKSLEVDTFMIDNSYKLVSKIGVDRYYSNFHPNK